MFNFEDLQVESKGVLLPEVAITNKERDSVKYEGEDNNVDFLKHLVNLGFKEKIQLKLIDPKDAQIYGDRAKYELEVLKETCFIDYILLLWRAINICKEESIPIGPGRGSAAGSLILYLLECTDCDPIKHDLFFERFISKSRCKVQVINGKNYLLGSLCDVDIDVDSNRREILLNRLSDLYKDKFCKVGTLSTLSSPILIKDLLKLGLNFKNEEAENYSKKITKEHGKAISIQRCYDELDFVKKVFDKHPDLFEMAKLLEGQVRGFGSHASAYLITNKEIDSCLPVERNKDKELVSSWDMDCSQKENIKLDLLGLNNVGIAQKVCELIGIKPSDIKYDDPFIYESLQDLKLPYGLFQIGADTNFRVTRKIKPSNIHELSDVLALARPGALSFVNEYCDTKSGNVEQVERHPEIDKILSWTKGCLLYQEQLMAIANRVFGISLEKSDDLRRCLSGDTRFLSQTRGWIKIETLLEEGYKNDLFLVVDNKGFREWKKIIDIWSTGKKTINRVISNSGLEVKATRYHQFLTDSGWKARDRLSDKDFLISCFDNDFKGIKTISDSLVIILAGMMTEGYFVYGRAPTFTNYDKEIYDLFLESCLKEFGEENFTKRPCGRVIALKKNAILILEKLLTRGKSVSKKIPEIIFRQDQETIAKFLSFSFSCEGTITEKELSFTSKSRELVQGLQLLLSNLYIKSYINIKKNKDYGNYYCCYISKSQNYKSVKTFNEKCGIYLQEYKKEKLLKFIKNRKNDISYFSRIPNSLLKRFMDQYPWVPHSVKKACGEIFKDKLDISRNKFLEFAEISNDQEWIDIAKANIVYDKMKGQEDSIKEIETFDFSMEEDHPYILANGIIVHNCVGKKKRDEILQWEQILRDKAKELNLSDDVVNFYWQVLLDSADYSFNRCIWEEELVKYPSGNEIMLKNVRVGSEILAEDKDGNIKYVTVLNVWRDRQPCFKVSLCNGRTIITSIKHKYYKEVDDNKYEMTPLENLDIGHFIKCKEGIGIIKDIEYVGERNTIDLEVDSEEHNFYCNGIVVSNSHSNAYAILSARTIYLKFKYPQLFFLVALEEANNLSSPTKEVREIARELRHFGIKLLPPDIIKSKSQFSIEDNNIRYGLKSIKGISETSLNHLFSFIDVEKTNKFSVFQAAQNAKVNLGIFVTLIYCGALDSLDKKGDRSKLALEAQLWSLMTDKEKVYLIKNGEKYDYNLFQAYKEIEEWQENGKRVAAKTRKETIKKNIEPYTSIYKNNSQNPKLTTFIHEKGLLGYSYSYSLSDLYHNNDVEKLSDIVNREKGSYCSFVAEVKEVTSSVSKKGDRFLKMKLVDETEELSGMLFGRKYESYLSGNTIPKEGEILYVVGQKGDDCVWCDKMEVQKCDVAFKKGDLEEILN